MATACNPSTRKPIRFREAGPQRFHSVSGNPVTRSGIFGTSGITVVELTIVVIIVASVAAIAAPAIRGYMDEIDNTEAVSRLTSIELCLDKYYAEYGAYPESLARIGKDGLKDPWGHTFVYQPLPEDRDICQTVARKAREVRLINSDYDLYSPGKDGKTDLSINKKRSWDDIVRAYNGSYTGLAKDIL